MDFLIIFLTKNCEQIFGRIFLKNIKFTRKIFHIKKGPKNVESQNLRFLIFLQILKKCPKTWIFLSYLDLEWWILKAIFMKPRKSQKNVDLTFFMNPKKKAPKHGPERRIFQAVTQIAKKAQILIF